MPVSMRCCSLFGDTFNHRRASSPRATRPASDGQW
jgi:hypothetical protein